ncbi:hypothetical protein ACFYV7_20085 [Nocardia suismassiliense]|uniref:Glyoxalase n=1 Tax=Nocardia suismassiliense TaxID=2077092 RepID=A0ABW6QV38_9NOCA
MAEYISAVPILTARDVVAATGFWVDRLGSTRQFGSAEFAGVTRDAVTVDISRVEEQ